MSYCSFLFKLIVYSAGPIGIPVYISFPYFLLVFTVFFWRSLINCIIRYPWNVLEMFLAENKQPSAAVHFLPRCLSSGFVFEISLLHGGVHLLSLCWEGVDWNCFQAEGPTRAIQMRLGRKFGYSVHFLSSPWWFSSAVSMGKVVCCGHSFSILYPVLLLEDQLWALIYSHIPLHPPEARLGLREKKKKTLLLLLAICKPCTVIFIFSEYLLMILKKQEWENKKKKKVKTHIITLETNTICGVDRGMMEKT